VELEAGTGGLHPLPSAGPPSVPEAVVEDTDEETARSRESEAIESVIAAEAGTDVAVVEVPVGAVVEVTPVPATDAGGAMGVVEVFSTSGGMVEA